MGPAAVAVFWPWSLLATSLLRRGAARGSLSKESFFAAARLESGMLALFEGGDGARYQIDGARDALKAHAV